MNKSAFWKGFGLGAIIVISLVVVAYFKFVVQPDLTLEQIEVQNLQQENIALTNYIGKPTVVNYWATWCAPCLAELPYFEEVKQQFGADINFVMISDESFEKIIPFVKSKDYSFNFLKTPKKLTEYGIYSIPATYFYDSQGNLANSISGGLDVKTLTEFINKLN